MSFPTPRLARSRRAAAVVALLAITLTPFTALAGPIAFDAAPRSAVFAAFDFLGAWWRVVADVFQSTERGGSDGVEQRTRSAAAKSGPSCDPYGGR